MNPQHAISLTEGLPLNTRQWLPQWHQQTVVIVASGPSLSNQQIALIKQSNHKVIVINDNYKKIPKADLLYACDFKWWDWHKDTVKDFKGLKVTRVSTGEKQLVDIAKAQMYGAHYFISKPNLGLSTDVNVIHEGINSGYQAINVAFHTGAKRALLVGYDMKLGPNNEPHWFGHHPDEVVSDYGTFRMFYPSLADACKQHNFEVINCTLDTALTCFPRSSLQNYTQNPHE